ncbi:MAG: FAD/NAD(P)-binding oxidoreductase [Anaerolineales bacterium]
MRRDYPFVILGGGMTAASAVKGIRQVNADLPIGIIAAENHPPYNRPPLSKGLWKGKPVEKIWRGTDSVPGVSLHLGRRGVRLDTAAKIVRDDAGDEYGYGKLLLAMGGTPRRLPFGGDRVIYFRTLDDYEKLRQAARPGTKFAVIGGGFIGSEVAASLRGTGADVSLYFPDAGIGARIFPPDLSENLNEYYREQGVDVRPGERVMGIEPRDLGAAVTSAPSASSGGPERIQEFDGVVAGIGIVPNVELAAAAGIEVQDGVVVADDLRTSAGDVFAAGDLASFSSPTLGRRLRVEHEDNANTMGLAAGRSMAGQPEPYRHLSFFYSDLFDLGYEAVGELDSRLQIFADWQEPFRKGVLYYLGDGRLRGVLLWNVWDQVDHARKLITEAGPVRLEDLKGRLPA